MVSSRNAEKLDEVGVDRIEAGMSAVAEQDFQAIREISETNRPSEMR
jgi:isopropylmalate/homocitrate/citramalate synthase